MSKKLNYKQALGMN